MDFADEQRVGGERAGGSGDGNGMEAGSTAGIETSMRVSIERTLSNGNKEFQQNISCSQGRLPMAGLSCI